MSHTQTQRLLIEHNNLMMVRDTMYQKLLRHEWKSEMYSAFR
ncbi:MAG: NblA/ycf18 family protein [Leptolyngbyaceae cyanobacterium CAN_BIN12]|nr:NblA/ycf18 family protein [Leptolyngbyaceae cyanobacterium CAN_BIN12]